MCLQLNRMGGGGGAVKKDFLKKKLLKFKVFIINL